MDKELRQKLRSDEDLMGLIETGLRAGHTHCYSLSVWTPEGPWATLATSGDPSKGGQANWMAAVDRLEEEGRRVLSITPLGTLEHLVRELGFDVRMPQ